MKAVLSGVAVLCLALGGYAIRGANGRAAEITKGTISLPETSGIALLGDRLLVAADDVEDEKDEAKRFHMVDVVGDARARLASGKITVSDDEQAYRRILTALEGSGGAYDFVTDFEDAAAEKDGTVYLITSHSQSKKGKSPVKRRRLIRLHLDSTGAVQSAQEAKIDLLASLPESLKESAKRRPEDAEPGFNIEGLAVAPNGDLLLGLRSPMAGSKAIVLRIADPSGLFGTTNPTVKLSEDASLDLGGTGIRGMFFDAKRSGYWLIGGLSSDSEPTPPNPWAIWFWDGKGKPKKVLARSSFPELQDLDAPEAITVIEPGGPLHEASILLVSDDGAGKPSSYRLVPLSRLMP